MIRRDMGRGEALRDAGTPSVAVIGGGFGGIAAGVKLKRAGIHTFTIFEKAGGPGGTWFHNSYPGAEVDTGSHMYSFSFKRYDWSRSHVRRDELLGYLEETVDDFGLRRHFRFGTAVEKAVWNEETRSYALHTEHGEVIDFDVVITAVGMFNVPRYPDWPGLADFRGAAFHSARWEHEHDLTGKRVAVVGTGSTSANIVPAIAPTVGHLYVFQREPGWVIPKRDRDYSAAERAAFQRPFAQRIERTKLFAYHQMLVSAQFPGTRPHARLKAQCLEYIQSVFADRPDLAKLVTPEYEFFGKRLVKSDTFYPALLRDNVELVPQAVTRVTPTGVVDGDGVERQVDVLVMATGFHASDYLENIEVVGRGGRTLQEKWNGDPEAFLGIMVPGFPNFFMLFGPNTFGGAGIAFMLECQADFAARAVKRLARRRARAIEVRESFMVRYNRMLQRKIRQSAWLETNNYYKSASGRVVTQYPYSAAFYLLTTKVLMRPSSSLRRR